MHFLFLQQLIAIMLLNRDEKTCYDIFYEHQMKFRNSYAHMYFLQNGKGIYLQNKSTTLWLILWLNIETKIFYT